MDNKTTDEIVEHYRSSGQEVYIDFESTQISTTVYEAESNPENTIVGVCGGPGVPKQHLAPLALLSRDGYRVVLYDQHNIGRSENHSEPYSVSTFLDELAEILSRYNDPVVVGHSWGAMLGLQYCIERDEPQSLVAVSPLFDVQENLQIAKTRRSEVVDSETAELLSEIEHRNTISGNGLYEDVDDTVQETLGFKPPVPSFVERWAYGNVNYDMYNEMWGKSEFHADEDAVLYNWSVKDGLDSITCPTLLTTGRDDMFGYHDLYYAENEMNCNSSVEIVEDASHTPTWETPTEFRKILLSWLSSQV